MLACFRDMWIYYSQSSIPTFWLELSHCIWLKPWEFISTWPWLLELKSNSSCSCFSKVRGLFLCTRSLSFFLPLLSFLLTWESWAGCKTGRCHSASACDCIRTVKPAAPQSGLKSALTPLLSCLQSLGLNLGCDNKGQQGQRQAGTWVGLS